MPYGDLTGSRAGRGYGSGGGAKGSYGAGAGSLKGLRTRTRTKKTKTDGFLAKYPGTCSQCGQPIRVGDIIRTRYPDAGKRLYNHATCQYKNLGPDAEIA